MNDNFEKDVRKTLEQGITAFECKVERLFKKYNETPSVTRIGKPLRYIYVDRENGFMKVQFKYTYTPQDIAFLEKVKSLPQEKIELVNNYVDRLAKGDKY